MGSAYSDQAFKLLSTITPVQLICSKPLHVPASFDHLHVFVHGFQVVGLLNVALLCEKV